MPDYESDDGSRLHYDVLGAESAPPVIVVAGGAARHPEYLGDLAGLSGRWRVVLPHLRGVGLSPAADPVERGSFWAQASDLERLRVHLGVERCFVVGHSAGTRVAVSFAAQFPDRLAGLVLIGPPTAYLVDTPRDDEPLAERRRGEPAFDAGLAALQTGPRGTTDEVFNAWQLVVAPTSYAVWGEREQAHARVGAYAYAANRAFFSEEPPADLVTRLGGVTAPVLVVAGADDVGTGLAPVLAVAELFPEGRAVVIEDCGHYSWVEQPAAFRRAVDPFLETCQPDSLG